MKTVNHQVNIINMNKYSIFLTRTELYFLKAPVNSFFFWRFESELIQMKFFSHFTIWTFFSIIDDQIARPGKRLTKKPKFLEDFEEDSETDEILSQIDDSDFDQDFNIENTQGETGKYSLKKYSTVIWMYIHNLIYIHICWA